MNNFFEPKGMTPTGNNVGRILSNYKEIRKFFKSSEEEKSLLDTKTLA